MGAINFITTNPAVQNYQQMQQNDRAQRAQDVQEFQNRLNTERAVGVDNAIGTSLGQILGQADTAANPTAAAPTATAMAAPNLVPASQPVPGPKLTPPGPTAASGGDSPFLTSQDTSQVAAAASPSAAYNSGNAGAAPAETPAGMPAPTSTPMAAVTASPSAAIPAAIAATPATSATTYNPHGMDAMIRQLASTPGGGAKALALYQAEQKQALDASHKVADQVFAALKSGRPEDIEYAQALAKQAGLQIPDAVFTDGATRARMMGMFDMVQKMGFAKNPRQAASFLKGVMQNPNSPLAQQILSGLNGMGDVQSPLTHYAVNKENHIIGFDQYGNQTDTGVVARDTTTTPSNVARTFVGKDGNMWIVHRDGSAGPLLDANNQPIPAKVGAAGVGASGVHDRVSLFKTIAGKKDLVGRPLYTEQQAIQMANQIGDEMGLPRTAAPLNATAAPAASPLAGITTVSTTAPAVSIPADPTTTPIVQPRLSGKAFIPNDAITGLPAPQTQQQYATLPVGARYKAPDGRVLIKGARH